MIRNYIKTAVRSLKNNKGFTLVNIFGLTLGIATCLLILFYVVDELSFDRYNTKADRIYRVNEDLKLGDNKVQYAVSMPPLAKVLKSDYPEVENAVRIKNAYGMHVKKGNEVIMENNVLMADPSLFAVFTLPMLYGNPATALAEPNSVVLTASSAKKYYNRVNAVGETLQVNDKTLLKVTGIIEDVPQQSHFKADFFLSMSSYKDSFSNEWLRSDYNTYVLLKEGADYKKLEAQFPTLLRKYSGSQMVAEMHMNLDAFEKSGSYFRLNLMPLTDIHLHANLTGELGANSTVQYVYIFSAIALFILLIACVNFMNLSTARSANRAREVGVRKVLGSGRKSLVTQFLLESVLVTLAATLMAMIVAGALLPLFNRFADKSITLSFSMLLWLIPAALALVVVVGCIAGLYPAFFLSAFQPIDVLKGKLAGGFKRGGLRSFLVVFQFFISIFLIVGTLVVYNQLHYIQNRDLGYNRNQVLIVDNVYELGGKAMLFKQQVKQLPGVNNVTLTGCLPTRGNRGTSIFYKTPNVDPKQSIFPQTWPVDEDYVPTLGMKMEAGRSFSARMGTDSDAVMINETAAKFLGLTHPVNTLLYKSSGGPNPVLKPYHIIGVVKDFNFNSLKENITPVVMMLEPDFGGMAVKVQTQHLPALMAQLEERWKSLSAVPMQYTFMDQQFDATYRVERRTGVLCIAFTTLAIIIACLGLFGLAAYAAEQRTKEIGIRKVLGANVASIVGLLSKEFIRLVLIALVIAAPLAWFAMNKWLQDFAYRVHLHWWLIVLAGAMALLIAFVTVSFQSIKAALANPVKSLRSE